MTMKTFLLIPCSLAIALLLTACGQSDRPAADSPEAAFFATFKQGEHLALMRHALAPGTGDPANFDLADRSTQRNLSAVGEAQAVAIGERFRANGVKQATVYTSQWFRCKETAELLNIGAVQELPEINSFFRSSRAAREAQLAALDTWLAKADLSNPTVFVTHQVVVTALSDIFPDSGEIILIKRAGDGWEVVDRLKTAP